MYMQCPTLQAVVDMCELSVQLWNMHACMHVSSGIMLISWSLHIVSLHI
jgi:hypothetical protein